MAQSQHKNQQVIVAIALAFALVANQVNASLFDPLVDTGVSPLSPDGKHVSVNLPGIISLTVDTRGPQKGARLAQSVMLGFVRVNLDRELDSEGKMRGPIKVSVAGITVYNNNEPELVSQPATAA